MVQTTASVDLGSHPVQYGGLNRAWKGRAYTEQKGTNLQEKTLTADTQDLPAPQQEDHRGYPDEGTALGPSQDVRRVIAAHD